MTELQNVGDGIYGVWPAGGTWTLLAVEGGQVKRTVGQYEKSTTYRDDPSCRDMIRTFEKTLDDPCGELDDATHEILVGMLGYGADDDVATWRA